VSAASGSRCSPWTSRRGCPPSRSLYFLHGPHDYTCGYAEAASYFDQLQAPLKGFYTFEHSAHSPMFEEPGRMMQILRDDVLGGTTRLADRR
jgi:pimeloyl-ACP methyl ester carboxylesterase